MKLEEFGNALFIDSELQVAEKDEKKYSGQFVNSALSLSKNNSSAAIIGGGDGGVARECFVIGKGKAYGKANCYTDCQFVRHNVVPEGATTRTPHVDNKNEVYAGLLYFKHDNSTGGGFNIHKQTFESGWDSKQNNALYEPGPIVDTCAYKDNNFVMFFNQKYAVHSVEPRAGVQSPRWSINMIGRWTQNRNW